MKGERGGTYWISPSGEKSYEGPGDSGGVSSPHPDTPAHAAESSRLWSDSSTSKGLTPRQSKAVHADLQSIASEKSPDRQASGVRSFAAKIAMLPIQAAKSIIESLVDFAGKMLRSGARIVGAVGINLAGIAAAGAAVAASTLLPSVVPGAVALALALPIGWGIKKMLGATSRLASARMRGDTNPGVTYAEQFAEVRAHALGVARGVWDAIDFERFAESGGSISIFSAGPHKFSSTQIQAPQDVADAAISFANSIPESELAGDGRETDIHITVKYGLHDDQPEGVIGAVSGFGPVRVRLGKVSIFPAKEPDTQRGGDVFDVVKVDVESPDLHRLNQMVCDAVPYTDTHPKYIPHMTIAYVRPGEGEKYVGRNDFDGMEFVADSILFSAKDGTRTVVPLSPVATFASGGLKGPYKGERGATYWLTSTGERTYDPPGKGGKESAKNASHTAKAESLLSRIADVPGDVVEGVSNFVGKTYDRLEKRYGGVGAKLVMGGMIALAPVPVPGTSLIPIALAEGVRRIGGLLGLRKHSDQWNTFAAEWSAYTNPKNGRRGAKSSGGRIAYGPEADRYLAGKTGADERSAPVAQNKPAEKTAPQPASAPERAPANPALGKVYDVALHDLHVDPARFQFKQDVKGPTGTGEELKGVTKFNPDFAGVVSVWKDPADGKTYVINGHHRYELAQRTGYPSLPVRYIDAPDATTARGKGALINIAEGRGTSVDAAKFMRDTGTTPEDFARHGVSLKGNVARDASVLMGLSDPLFSRVARGTLNTDRAMAIAAHLPDKDKQIELLHHVEREEQRTKKEYTPKVIAEAATEMAHTPTVTTTTNSLFGPEVNERSLFMQRNELKSHIRGELSREARDFKVVASQRRADAIAGDGNTLNVKANQARAHQAENLADTFTRLASYKGPLSDILNEQAEKYASASTDKSRDAIRSDTFRRVREALSKVDGG